ncbi:hypothetical protein Tco_1502340, partial [Tanacetum coccineum]
VLRCDSGGELRGYHEDGFLAEAPNNQNVDDDQHVGDEEIEEWLMVQVMPPRATVTVPSTSRLEVIDDLCDRMSNLEYRHRELVKKMVIVSNAEMTDRITIGEIHP